jgi:hypothetical protein
VRGIRITGVDRMVNRGKRSEERVRQLALTFATMMAITATVSASAQMPKNVLRVHQTQVRLITTPNGLVTAVVGGANANPGLGDFVFCVMHAKPLAQPLNWSGPATVVYEAMGQFPGFEPAPEQLGIGSGVAVLPENGAGWLFEGDGIKAPLRPEDQAKATKAARLPAQIRMAPTKPARLSFCANVPGGG